jgi:hypothetical protein
MGTYGRRVRRLTRACSSTRWPGTTTAARCRLR